MNPLVTWTISLLHMLATLAFHASCPARAGRPASARRVRRSIWEGGVTLRTRFVPHPKKN